MQIQSRMGGWLAVLGAALLFSTSLFAQEANPAVEHKVVKYDALLDAIKQGKGQVVVVDFWADFCVPCKKGFPHLVELHDKHAKEGLKVISVNLDDPTDAEVRAKSIKFLKDKKATFTNLFVDAKEKPEDWFNRLKFESIPCVMVFNRDGKLEMKFVEDGVDHEAVEKLVVQLLKKK